MKKKILASVLFALIYLVSYSQDCQIKLDFSAFDLGSFHNKVLEKLIKAKSRTEIETIVFEWDYNPAEINKEEFLGELIKRDKEILKYDPFDYKSIPNELINETVKPFFGQIVEGSRKIESLEEYYNLLDAIQNDADKNLKCNDLDQITASIIIAKSSSKF